MRKMDKKEEVMGVCVSRDERKMWSVGILKDFEELLFSQCSDIIV